jgi:L-lactate dehydrogenase complex protein LldE
MSKVQVDIFIPCFIDQMYPETGFNMVKILEALGCEVFYNAEQTCCGQPAYNAGFFDDARDVATKFLEEFKNEKRYIVTPSGSCAGMLKNGYTTLFKQTPNLHQCRLMQKTVYEFTQFITDILKIDTIPGAKLNGKVTYHDSCSALRECGIKSSPRTLLANVEGVELIEMQDVETCCGFGGTFAVKFEPISVAMAEQKVANAIDTEAEYIVSTDTSCLMHLDGYIQKQGKQIKVMHIADVLASGW